MLYIFSFFFFNDTATTEIYTLSLHDALPICLGDHANAHRAIHEDFVSREELQRLLEDRHELIAKRIHTLEPALGHVARHAAEDRKSTRLNSSHSQISYAVFCLKKKHTHERTIQSGAPGRVGHVRRRGPFRRERVPRRRRLYHSTPDSDSHPYDLAVKTYVRAGL